MHYQEIIKTLKTMEQPKNVQGMMRYGINPTNNLGISIYHLRLFAKEISTNHDLALTLWDSGIHDARLLAVFIDDPTKVTSEQMDAWAADFNSWDICDQACTSLFDQTPYAWNKVYAWANREEEFVKRGAFSILAGLAVHDKKATDDDFEQCTSILKQCSTDDRNYVKKAVNWALRNIGKRNQELNKTMIQLSKELLKADSRSARWIAHDALRELTSEKIQHRIKTKKKKK